jgi:hypothetical protein
MAAQQDADQLQMHTARYITEAARVHTGIACASQATTHDTRGHPQAKLLALSYARATHLPSSGMCGCVLGPCLSRSDAGAAARPPSPGGAAGRQRGAGGGAGLGAAAAAAAGGAAVGLEVYLLDLAQDAVGSCFQVRGCGLEPERGREGEDVSGGMGHRLRLASAR